MVRIFRFPKAGVFELVIFGIVYHGIVPYFLLSAMSVIVFRDRGGGAMSVDAARLPVDNVEIEIATAKRDGASLRVFGSRFGVLSKLVDNHMAVSGMFSTCTLLIK